MRLRNSCTWFKIRWDIFNIIRHSFSNNFLSEGNKRFATSCVKLVFEISESFSRDLDVSWDEIAWDSWMEFVKFFSKNNIVLSSHKQMIRNDWLIPIRTTSKLIWRLFKRRAMGRWLSRIRTASTWTDLAYDLILLFTAIVLLFVCFIERILLLLNWH